MKRPLFWWQVLLRRDNRGSSTLFWAALFSVLWLFLHYMSGFLFGFINTGPQISAFAAAMLAIVLRELLRSVLSLLFLRHTKHPVAAGAALAVLFALAEALWADGTPSPAALLPALWSSFLPKLAGSALLTALSMNGGMAPGLLYGVMTQAVVLLIPVSPALRPRLAAMMELVVCMMFLIALDCDFSPAEKKEPPKKRRLRGIGALVLCAIPIGLVTFFAGLLPWQPVAIATGSMEPEILTGSMVIVSKLDTDNLQEGDIIQFSRNGYTVVHRIVQLQESGSGTVYITKGDANNATDEGVVTQEAVIGKVVATVPSIGSWALWLHGG